MLSCHYSTSSNHLTANMLSSDPKNAFWEAGEKDYESRRQSRPATSRFWLSDEMNYIVLDVIGRGAFASVWRAKERESGKLLAVKRFERADTLRIRREVRDEAQILDTIRDGVSSL